MLPFRRVVCPLSHIPSHDHSPSVSEEAWGGPSEAEGLLCMASVGEYENNLTLPPSGGSEGEGLSSHTDMNLTFKVVLLGVQG